VVRGNGWGEDSEIVGNGCTSAGCGPLEKCSVGWPFIRVARAEANRLFVHRRNLPRPLPIPLTFRASLEAMDSFEVNKILGAILGTCLGVLSINIAAGAIFAPEKPAKPGYELGVPEQAPAGKPGQPEKPA